VPFNAPNYNALLRAIVEDRPRPVTDFAAGDLQLSEIIYRGLAKSPEARYPSMGELGHALAVWLLSHGVQEDACGTSLDSKWLSRASDPTLLAGGTEHSLPALDSSRRRTHDSNPSADAVDSRGPFTATIRPEVVARTRVRRLTAAAALVGALSLALWFLAPRHSPPSAGATAWLGQRSERPLPPPAPKAVAPRAEANAAPVAAPQVSPASVVAIPVSALPVAKAPAAISLARGSQTAPSPRPVSRRVTTAAASAPATVAPATVASHPAASARPKPSELDLLSPY